MGTDESKVRVGNDAMPLWPTSNMITVLSHKSILTINWLLGSMRHVRIGHGRIAIYNGFVGMHQKCWHTLSVSS